MTGKRGFQYSTTKTSKYVPKHAKPDMYESFWGTLSHHDSRRFTSLKLATHPLIAWATTLRTYADRHGTPEERDAVYDVLLKLADMHDFVGVRTFALNIDSAGIAASARVVRL